MENAETSPGSSSRDALMGAGLGCGVALVGAAFLGGLAWLAIARRIGNPDVLGSASADAALAVLVLAAVSGGAWARRARRVAQTAAVVALVLTIAPLIAAIRTPGRFAHPPLDERERAAPQPYERDGTQVLIQPALALELLAPEGLELLSSEETAVPQRESASSESASVQWSWTNEARDRALIVHVGLTVAHDDPADDARYVEGVLSGELEGMGPAGLVVLETERRGPSEHVVLAEHDQLGILFVRTTTYRHGDTLVTVTATAMGPEHESLIPVVESVRGRPEYTRAL